MINNFQYSISLKGIDLEDKKTKRLIEDSLEDFHFSYWAIPPNAPVDVVRMVGQTEHGHSFLQFSNKLAYLVVNFDDSYKNDAKCMEYAHKRLSKLVETLEKLKVEVTYNGVIAQYIYNDIPYPIELLRSKIVCVDINPVNLHSLGVRITFLHNQKYFINFDISSLISTSDNSQALGIMVDVNDKYGVENGILPCSINNIFDLMDIQKQIDQKMIMKILKEGKIDLHECD